MALGVIKSEFLVYECFLHQIPRSTLKKTFILAICLTLTLSSITQLSKNFQKKSPKNELKLK